MLSIIAFLSGARFIARQAEKPRHEIGHPLINLGEQITFSRVERIV